MAIAVVASVLVALGAWRIATGNEAALTTQEQPAPDAAPGAQPSQAPSPAGSAGPGDAPEVPVTVVNGVELPEANVAPPVTFEEPAQIAPEFSAAVTEVRAIDGVGQGIGEISGPALAFTVTLTNNTDAPLDTVGVVVNCYDATAAPAIPLLGDPNAKPLPDRIAPGQTATGVYVFLVPKDARDTMTLTVAFNPADPTVVFSGPLPS